MLIHKNESKTQPKRIVVLGTQGFVASHIIRKFKQENVEIYGISKDEINLLNPDSHKQLSSILKNDDTLVIVSAIAPCKNIDMMMNNFQIIQNVCKAVENISLSHVIYVSSDAVYADEETLVTENSVTSPSSFHGMMHFCRELMLKQAFKNIPLAILRPSLLYGKEDPHNGYGPNRFRRIAEKNEEITLFGNGEEKRDHVFIEDVSHIVSLVAHYRSEGILNIATGDSHSFREIAEYTLSEINSNSEIKATPRNNPIVHRHFDIANFYKAFPEFRYHKFKMGLKKIVTESLTQEEML